MRNRFLRAAGLIALLTQSGALTSCSDTPLAPSPENTDWSYLAPRIGSQPFPVPIGTWQWRVLRDDSTRTTNIRLATEFHDGEFRWRWTPALTVSEHSRRLEPLAAGIFHRQTVPAGAPVGPPLPIQLTDSIEYPHVLGLLQELTTPLFDQTVVHWPDLPIPVRTGGAVAGRTDLGACLIRAAEIWNEGASEPWFRIDEQAGWGVRLIHLPDLHLSPPLEIRLTRLTDSGGPMRMNLMAGNNYDDLRDPIYAVRGFVHELGHALLLWGHTRDRNHVLWGAAPPLVDAPSADERKAARLWHGLPEGLDLSLYR